MRLGLKVDTKEAQRAVQKAPVETLEAIHKTLLQVAIKTQATFRKNMPTGKTGMLRKTVNIVWLNKVAVKIEPTEEYADYVEHGTRPHFPPIDAITPWARMRGIDPYRLAWGIAHHGTKAHPYLMRTFQEVEPFAEQQLEKNIKEVIDKTI